MKLRSLALAACVLAIGLTSVSVAAAAKRPNIVFILADDLGYVDINAYAARLTAAKTSEMFYETPHIDRLVREGTSFGQAYACQLCSPTRAGLLTGKIAARIGVTTATPNTVRSFYNQGIAPPSGYLANDALYWGDPIKIQQALLNGSTLEALPSGQPLDQGRDEITIAEALTGYRSAFIGKCHLGGHGSTAHQNASADRNRKNSRSDSAKERLRRQRHKKGVNAATNQDVHPLRDRTKGSHGERSRRATRKKEEQGNHKNFVKFFTIFFTSDSPLSRSYSGKPSPELAARAECRAIKAPRRSLSSAIPSPAAAATGMISTRENRCFRVSNISPAPARSILFAMMSQGRSARSES